MVYIYQKHVPVSNSAVQMLLGKSDRGTVNKKSILFTCLYITHTGLIAHVHLKPLSLFTTEINS